MIINCFFCRFNSIDFEYNFRANIKNRWVMNQFSRLSPCRKPHKSIHSLYLSILHDLAKQTRATDGNGWQIETEPKISLLRSAAICMEIVTKASHSFCPINRQLCEASEATRGKPEAGQAGSQIKLNMQIIFIYSIVSSFIFPKLKENEI